MSAASRSFLQAKPIYSPQGDLPSTGLCPIYSEASCSAKGASSKLALRAHLPSTRLYKNIISTCFVCRRTCNHCSTFSFSAAVGILLQCTTTTTCASVVTILFSISVPLASVTRVISGSCVRSSAASCAAGSSCSLRSRNLIKSFAPYDVTINYHRSARRRS